MAEGLNYRHLPSYDWLPLFRRVPTPHFATELFARETTRTPVRMNAVVNDGSIYASGGNAVPGFASGLVRQNVVGDVAGRVGANDVVGISAARRTSKSHE